jgi:uncharacterized protein YggE
MRKVLLAVLVLLVGVPVFVYVTNPLMVTVAGSGEVDAKPDSATVAFMITTQRETSDLARTDAEGKAKALESILIGFGAKKEDIARSQATVSPSGLADASKKFTATISMGGKIANYAQAGALVSSLYSNGAVYVSQPVLTSGNSTGLETQAYDKAMQQAATEASRIGNQNFKFIRKRVAIVQASTGDSGSVTNVVSNSLKISKTVSVTYKMW